MKAFNFFTLPGTGTLRVNSSYQKIFVQGKWAILGMKMAHPHNSGSVVRIVLQFCIMEVAKRDVEINDFSEKKKSYLGRFGLFGPKTGTSS